MILLIPEVATRNRETDGDEIQNHIRTVVSVLLALFNVLQAPTEDLP
jgi:hypothetical protein